MAWYSAFVLQLCAGGVLRFIPIRILHPCIPPGSSDCGCSPDHSTFPTERCDRIPAFQGIGLFSFRAAKEILYIPLSFDARYRAKQVIDSFGYRFAKGGSAGVITVIGFAMAIPGAAYSITAMIMAILWSGIVLNLTKQYQNIEMRDDGREEIDAQK